MLGGTERRLLTATIHFDPSSSLPIYRSAHPELMDRRSSSRPRAVNLAATGIPSHAAGCPDQFGGVSVGLYQSKVKVRAEDLQGAGGG